MNFLSIIYKKLFGCNHEKVYLHFEYLKSPDGDVSAEPTALRCALCKTVLEEY